MTMRNCIRLIVYRIHEKGLEVFLLKPQQSNDKWSLVESTVPVDFNVLELLDQGIEMDIQDADGRYVQTIAIDGDRYDIPRIRTLIRQDVGMVKEKIKHLIPEITDGSYVAVKEAFKKLLPHEYAALKELKDIVLDRNLLQNI